MISRRVLLATAVVAAVAYPVYRWLQPSRDAAPAAALVEPVEVGASRLPPPLRLPRHGPERYVRIHLEAVEQDDPLPGTTAYREYAADYVAANPEFVDHHMIENSLSREQVLELTFFGLLAMRTMDWEDVEAVMGQPVGKEARATAYASMRKHSEEMKAAMAAHAAANDSQATRSATIQRIEDGYLSEYFAATGMDQGLLDELLRLTLLAEMDAVEEPIPEEELAPPAEEPEPETPEAAASRAASMAPPPPRPPRTKK